MAANRWVILGVLFIVRISLGFQFQSVASVSPNMIQDLSIGYAEIGTLIGLYLLPGVVIALPGGLLGKRFGDKRTASCGLLFMVTGGILLGLSQSYPLAIAGRLVSGIGAVLFSVMVTKMVTDWFADKELRTALGVMLASWPFGIALGLVSHSALADIYSWQLVMYLTAAVSAIAFGLVVMLYRPPPATTPSDERSSVRMIPLRELLSVSMAGLAWAVFNMGFVIFVSFAPGVLTARGMSTSDASTLASIAVWITIVSVPLGGYLTDRSGRPKRDWSTRSAIISGACGTSATAAPVPVVSCGVWPSWALLMLWPAPPLLIRWTKNCAPVAACVWSSASSMPCG